MQLSFTEADIFEAGVDQAVGAEELRAALRAGRPIRVKLGIDPTSPNIHLGRSTVLWRLRAFQELGCHIDLVLGDFTGQIGDTSDKDSERPMLTAETIRKNLERYLEQAWMILNPEKKDQVTVHYNSRWLSPLTLADLTRLADAFSVNQFVKRELIAKRLESGSRVSLREMLYPLMQGYDSVHLESDVELGGTDQWFNMLAGRTLQEALGSEKPQAVITGKIISGTDGRKMSSSWGNTINLLDSPADKFGKLMSAADDVMHEYLMAIPLCAQPFTEKELKSRIELGENPRDLKMRLAEALVALYHGNDVASATREAFIAQFTEKQLPSDIPVFSLQEHGLEAEYVDVPTLLVQAGLAESKSEARRLLDQGAVSVVGGETLAELMWQAELPAILKVGKRRYLQVQN